MAFTVIGDDHIGELIITENSLCERQADSDGAAFAGMAMMFTDQKLDRRKAH